MTDPRPTILPTGSTALERAVDQSAPRWDTLAAAAHPLDGRHPEPFKLWLAAEWALAEFARYFATTDALIAAALPASPASNGGRGLKRRRLHRPRCRWWHRPPAMAGAD